MTNNDFERAAIENIQRYLRQLSFHEDNIGPVPIDGIWDSETIESLKAFQQSRSLPVTGTVDRATWDVLKAEYDKSVALNSPPAMIDLFPREPDGYEVSLGDEGILVYVIQYMLSELERLYSFENVTRSGVYDEDTANTVKYFQLRNNIDPTGRVGRETWDALAIQHNLLDRYDE